MGCGDDERKRFKVFESPEIYVFLTDDISYPYAICVGGEERRIRSLEAEFVKLALYELGYDNIARDGRAMLRILSKIREISSNMSTPSITVDIKSVSDREEIIFNMTRVILDTYSILTINSEIMCFRDGIYQPCEDMLRKTIETYAEKSGLEIEKKTLRAVVNETIDKIRRKTMVPVEEINFSKAIAFLDGYLDLEDFISGGAIQIQPFNPDIYVFHKINYSISERLGDLDKNIDIYAVPADIESIASSLCPRTLEIFREWVGGSWETLFEIIGYTFIPDYPLQKAFMLVGEGSNGKTTYLNLIKAILGRDNVVHIPIQELVEDKFAVSNLYRKLANIFPDLPDRPLKYSGIFKALVGGDYICGQRKFIQRPLCFKNYAKLIFSANELPPVTDRTYAFWRRWVIVEFPNQFPADPSFFERNFSRREIEGIIIASLYAVRNVLHRGKFSSGEDIEGIKEKWFVLSNNIYAFMKEMLDAGYIVRDSGSYIKVDDLYTIYTTWCSENDETPKSKKMFTQELERLFGIKRDRKQGSRVYLGLRLRENPFEGEGYRLT